MIQYDLRHVGYQAVVAAVLGIVVGAMALGRRPKPNSALSYVHDTKHSDRRIEALLAEPITRAEFESELLQIWAAIRGRPITVEPVEVRAQHHVPALAAEGSEDEFKYDVRRAYSALRRGRSPYSSPEAREIAQRILDLAKELRRHRTDGDGLREAEIYLQTGSGGSNKARRLAESYEELIRLKETYLETRPRKRRLSLTEYANFKWLR